MRRRTAAHFDRYAATRAAWRALSPLYYGTIERLCRREIPPGARVLEVGCGVGDLLAAVRPSFGVGIDVSRAMIAEARRRHASSAPLHFYCADVHDLALASGAPPFDYVICSDLLGHLADIQVALAAIRRVCSRTAKVVITYWNFAWQVPLLLAERVGAKMPQGAQNWLGMADVDNLLRLTHFETLREGTEILLPKDVPLLAPLLNRAAIRLPFLDRMGLCTYWVARPAPVPAPAALSTSVIIPCRNEEGNIPACIDRLPPLGTHTEVIFVDGASTDGTRDRILEQIER
ncbi:MAG TPA: methyltransferase, partial [Chloroflexota bacterium]|nr:methyltransferase [Chloroflexota bacterium]